MANAIAERGQYAPEITKPVREQADRTVRMSDVVESLVRRARLLVAIPFAAALVAIGPLLLLKNYYTASVTIAPEPKSGGAMPGQLAGLAALAGVSIGAAGGTQSPQFYQALLLSRPIQYSVLQRRYSGQAAGDEFTRLDSVTLLTALRPRGDTPAKRLWDAAKRLSQSTQIGVDTKTGILRLSFEHTSPRLAAAVANAYVEELARFNRLSRQSQARLRREFVESQTASAGNDLRLAEENVRQFLAANRSYQNSPSLTFEYGRLQRALQVQQELYLDLRRQLDAARISEVDDTPTFTTIEPAIVPAEKSRPHRSIWLIAIVLATAIATALGAIAVDHHAALFPGAADELRQVFPVFLRRRRRAKRAVA